MTTITAKELRDDLEDIVKRVSDGEKIAVTYRNRLAFELVKDESSHFTAKKNGVNTFLARVEERKLSAGEPIFDPDKSIKELYHEMLDNDPKYQSPK